MGDRVDFFELAAMQVAVASITSEKLLSCHKFREIQPCWKIAIHDDIWLGPIKGRYDCENPWNESNWLCDAPLPAQLGGVQ
jgi:hypothetical protein